MEFLEVEAVVDFPNEYYRFTGLVSADEYEKYKDDVYREIALYVTDTNAPPRLLKTLRGGPNDWFGTELWVAIYEIEEVKGRVIVPIGTPPLFPEVLQTSVGRLWYTATKGGFNDVAQ